MNILEFNEKWKCYLEERFYGLAIDDKDVIAYLDKEFEIEISNNKDFEYSQVKLKFNSPRVYTNSDKNSVWEKSIAKILKNKNK